MDRRATSRQWGNLVFTGKERNVTGAEIEESMNRAFKLEKQKKRKKVRPTAREIHRASADKIENSLDAVFGKSSNPKPYFGRI